MMKFLNNKKFKHGSMAMVVTIIFIAVVVVLNIVISILVERFPLRLDFTDNSMFTMADDTKKFLADVDMDVNITMLETEENLKNLSAEYFQVYNTLKSFEQHSGKVKLVFKDYNKNPGIAAEYEDLTISKGDIIVQSDLRYSKIGINDCFVYADNPNPDGSVKINSSIAEEKLTTEILKVTQKELIKVSYISKPTNFDISEFLSLLSSNIYEVGEQSLTVGEFDDSVKLLIISAPTTDFTDDELNKIEDFLYNKGNFDKGLLYIPTLNQSPLPKLDSFLEQWGIKVEKSVMFETNPAVAIGDNFGIMSHLAYNDEENNPEWLDKFESKGAFIGAYGVSPITRLYNVQREYSTYSLLESSGTTVTRPLTDDETEEQNWSPDTEVPETYSLCVVSERKEYQGVDQNSSVVATLAGTSLVDEQFLYYPTFMNTDFMMALCNQIADVKPAITVMPKEFIEDTISLSQLTSTILMYIFWFGLPVLTIGTGMFIFIKRRNK